MLYHAQWNAFVELLPLWLAPNMVTLLGFLFIIANVGLVLVYVPDLVGPVGRTFFFRFPREWAAAEVGVEEENGN